MKYRAYRNEFWNEKEAKELFQIVPFNNFLIEKPKIKHLSNMELLHELPFYDGSFSLIRGQQIKHSRFI